MTTTHTVFTGSIPENYDRYLGPLIEADAMKILPTLRSLFGVPIVTEQKATNFRPSDSGALDIS